LRRPGFYDLFSVKNSFCGRKDAGRSEPPACSESLTPLHCLVGHFVMAAVMSLFVVAGPIVRHGFFLHHRVLFHHCVLRFHHHAILAVLGSNDERSDSEQANYKGRNYLFHSASKKSRFRLEKNAK
jgi:hypothetical protein